MELQETFWSKCYGFVIDRYGGTGRYGVSWQVVPTILDKLLANPDPVGGERMMKAMLQMKKLDIAQLEKAYYSA